MRTIEQTSQFKRDYKREAKGPHRQTLASEFVAIVTTLANDQPLPDKHRDHALTGGWKYHRDCHVKPDLALIYRKPDDAILQLVRFGSHSELGFCVMLPDSDSGGRHPLRFKHLTRFGWSPVDGHSI